MKAVRYISPTQMYKSQQKTKLLCEFYGYHHTKCKKAVKRDEILYMRYMKQFYDDNDDFFSDTKNKDEDS